MTVHTLKRRVKLASAFPTTQSEGQGLAEYALIVFLVSIAVITALGAFGAGANSLYDTILGLLPF